MDDALISSPAVPARLLTEIFILFLIITFCVATYGVPFWTPIFIASWFYCFTVVALNSINETMRQ